MVTNMNVVIDDDKNDNTSLLPVLLGNMKKANIAKIYYSYYISAIRIIIIKKSH